MRFSYIMLAFFMVSMAAAVDSVDVYVFGLSHHQNRSIVWNEKNPGLALGLSHQLEENPNVDVTIDAGMYKDSYFNRAKFALIGIRCYAIGERESWHTTVQCGVGYYEGSGWRGPGFSANVAVGYNRVDLCMTGCPSAGPNPDQCSWYAMFLRIRALDF